MKLLTEAQRTKLLENGTRRGADHEPVVKLFNPCGAGTWLLSELDPEYPDECGFGLADLGFGTPELGSIGLLELTEYRGPFGLGIERDIHFTANYPLTIYAKAARAAGSILESGPELEAAARILAVTPADAAGSAKPATRHPTLSLAIASIALAALMAGNPGTSGALAQAAPGSPNYSSHTAAFFTGLLEGRVWILERPNSRRAGDRNTVWAHYHGPDGTLRACAHLGGAYAPGTARWRVVPSREFRALYNFNEPGVEPDPGQRRGHTPVFYDPATGVLHNEALGAASGVWAVASRGWVQESWPRAMKDACPDLALPADLQVNEKQISTAFDKMMAQDTDAPLHGFPGSELRGPGATGIAASGGHATLPAAALKRFLADNDGRVLVDNAGARHVLALGRDRDELWLLDGIGGIADTGHLVPAAGGGEIALHYERLPMRPRFRVGDALPLLPTGERYAAIHRGE